MRVMNRKGVIGFLVVTMAVFSVAARAADQKIVSVQIKKVFEEYWKSKQLKDFMERKGEETQAELAELDKNRKTLIEEYRKAKMAESSPILTPAAREKKAQEANAIRQNVVMLERKMKQKQTEFRRLSETERGVILKELMKLLATFSKKSGYSFAVDASAAAASRPAPVLYAAAETDITEAFLAEINKGHEIKKKTPEKKPDVQPVPEKKKE